MIDLNDLYLFSKVVEHQGITAAAGALGMARSKVSRRITGLEERLGTILIHRSTRHFAVTDLGREFNEHCLAMMAAAHSAADCVAQAQAAPNGVIRIHCPTMLAQFVIGPLLPAFMKAYPEIRIALDTDNREVNIEENFDLEIRIRHMPYEDSSQIVRPLGIYQPLLVASPAFLDEHGRPESPNDLATMATISHSSPQGPHVWSLVDPDHHEVQVKHNPVLIVDEFVVIRLAALQGLGVTLLPLGLCRDDLRNGALEIVLPQYLSILTELHVTFPSRRGILPAVRHFIDYLGKHCSGDLERHQIMQGVRGGRREKSRFWVSRIPVSELVFPTPRLAREAG
ncbi:LysR family transcriptional regulator [Caulobacter soli]|uniref:LysR family transcriptional regulator n=1 Tax=Caulobacter soli TaxID=2708539 RepID=UPI0013ED99B6|nr:LysR family transcriptional regulator [Caulobacter soli]